MSFFIWDMSGNICVIMIDISSRVLLSEQFSSKGTCQLHYKPHILHYDAIINFKQGLAGHTKDKLQILIIFLKNLIKKSK